NPFCAASPGVKRSPMPFGRGAAPMALPPRRHRTANQTVASKFWNASTVSYFWDRAAVTLAAQRRLSLSQNAHLLALLNIAMAGAAIACWDGKYTYVFWRPVTAIPSLTDDGNAATDPDTTWLPLLITLTIRNILRAIRTTSGAAATVLAAYLGEETSL